MGRIFYKEKEARKFQVVEDPAKLAGLIRKYFINKPYFIAGDQTRQIVTAVSFEEPNRVIIDSRIPLEGVENVYAIFKKYVDFICMIEQEISPQRYAVRVESCRVAAEGRKEDRHPVDQSKVYINNIRASRNVINASLFNVPTSVKVHFKQYQQALSGQYDEAVVDVYDKSSEKLELVRRMGKILYVADTRDPSSYSPGGDDFIDYAYQSDLDVPELMRDYRIHKVVSEMIVPVVYQTHEESLIPLGYIQLISRKEPIPREKADEMVELAREMVRKMRDSNTVVIKERQDVENISKGGMRLRISHGELKTLLAEQSGVTFDLVFKMTQPITISTEVVYRGMLDGDLILGLKIVGHSSKTGDFNRYYTMVDTLAR